MRWPLVSVCLAFAKSYCCCLTLRWPAGPRPPHFCAGRGLYDGPGLTLRWAATPLRLVPLSWGPEQCPTQRVAIPGNLEITSSYCSHARGNSRWDQRLWLNLRAYPKGQYPKEPKRRLILVEVSDNMQIESFVYSKNKIALAARRQQ